MLRQYRLKDYNFRLIIWVIALSVVGILVIGSAKESVQTKQIAGLILGLVVMVITSLIDYSWVLGFYWLSYFVGIGLLAAVLLAGENVWCNTLDSCGRSPAVSAFRCGKNPDDRIFCQVFFKT